MNITEPLSPSIRGLMYPLTVEKGNLAVQTDYGIVTQQIRSIVETRYYERVMRADYGIDDYVLNILDPSLINSSIQQAILDNVNGLSALNVMGDWISEGDGGLYRVFIEYSVNGVPQPPLNFALAN